MDAGMKLTGDRNRHGSGERGVPALDMLPPRPLCIALVIALVSTIISLSASAAEGVPAADEDPAYASPEAAFAAVFLASGLGERGYWENREYAAAFYEMPDGSWHSTPIVAGTRTESAIPYHAVPPAALRIVGAHTHGQPHIPEDAWHLYGTDFSKADLRNAVHNYRATNGRIAAQFLLSSQLNILRLTLTGEPELALGVAFVRSPEEARLTPGAIHGTTELLGRLALPAAARTVGEAARTPQAADARRPTALALGGTSLGGPTTPARD
jgi:hypothetical protein